MADEKQLRVLQEQGVDAWNDWRLQAEDIDVDLSGADLSKAYLNRANLVWANLGGVNLTGAAPQQCLFSANRTSANLSEAFLSEANLFGAALRETNLSGAKLQRTNLSEATLVGADLREAHFFETILSNVDLSGCKNLDSIRHDGPSPIDIWTLRDSAACLPARRRPA